MPPDRTMKKKDIWDEEGSPQWWKWRIEATGNATLLKRYSRDIVKYVLVFFHV